MPILKAGISTCRYTTGLKKRLSTTRNCRCGAFTFVEVMIALAIVSISVLALLRLNLISARMVDKAHIISHATLLADEKIAEVLVTGFPEEGTRSGNVEKNGLTMNWRTQVEDMQLVGANAENVAGLRRVRVDVTWKQGASAKHLQLSTCVADRRLP